MAYHASGMAGNCQLRKGSARKPLDMGAALAELLLDALKTSVEVIDTADHGLPLRGEPGDDERHRGPQVGGHDLRATQAVNAGDEGGVALEIDAGAKTRELLHMHEAVLEDGLAHLRGAVGRAHQGDELGLQVGGEA